MPAVLTGEIRPGIRRPDWSVLTRPAARAALESRDRVRAGISEKWNQALEATPDLVWRTVVDLFARLARPPLMSEIAETAKLPVAQVGAIVADVYSHDLLVMDDSASAIVHAYPFAGQPTDHRVELSGQELYAVCAIDALGVAGMLRKDATIRSTCRTCGTAIEIVTAGNGKSLSDRRPVGSVVWYDLAYNRTAAASCCPAIGFFCSGEHLEQWLLNQTPKRTGCRLTLDEALEVGRALFEPVLATTSVR